MGTDCKIHNRYKKALITIGDIMGIKLDLTIAETNVVLASLSKQPYEAVASVITKIQQQGGPQAEAVQAEEDAAKAETPAA